MSQPPLTRQVQDDFSAGMWRAGPVERIPANGCYDITNGFVDFGATFKRGGSSYRATAFGAGLRFIWDGWLASGQVTMVASTADFGKIAAGAVTNLGGAGMSVAGRPAVYEGKIYLPGGFTYDGTTVGTAAKEVPYYAVVANRLLAASGDRVDFSKIGKPAEYAGTDFHKLPGGVEILGLAGLRSSAAVFTTAGVWIIGNLGHNLTDEAGNVQQTLDLYSRDLVLWGNGGIAAWEGGMVVPATDGVYLMSLGVTSERAPPFQRISDPIVDLYQSYVRSGYLPGQATVYRNHYMLPIIGAGEVVDLLVCRLDMPSRPWTHLRGAGAKVAALTTRVVSGSSRTPELLGALYAEAKSRPVTLLYFDPSANNETDMDGSIPDWTLTTRAYPTGSLVRNLISKLRLRYQLAGKVYPPPDPARNLVINPGFEYSAVGTEGWISLSGVLLTRITTEHQSGAASMAVSNLSGEGLVPGTRTQVSGVFKAGLKLVASLYIKGAAAGETIRTQLHNEGGASSAFKDLVLTEGWQKVEVALTLLEDATALQLSVFQTVTKSATFYIDSVRVDKGTVAAAYKDGDSSEWSWVGTKGHSESVEVLPAVPPPAKIGLGVSTEGQVPAGSAAVWGAFAWGAASWATPGAESFDQLEGEAPFSIDGSDPYRWRPRKKRRFVRFRFTCQGATSQLAIRAIEVFTRPEGRL